MDSPREIKFSISVTRREWLEMDPHVKTCVDGRDYRVFNTSWTWIFNSKIWEAVRLPCRWKFNHLKFHTRPRFAAFTFDAICTARTCQKKINNKSIKCENFLKAKCYEIPEDQSSDIIVQMTTFDSSKIPHFGQRSVAGKARANMKQWLKNSKAIAVQVAQANDIMQTSDILPTHIPSLEVIRKMAMERKNESLNLDLYLGDPCTSLSEIQEENNFIRQFDASPFNVQYVTDDQIKLFREATEQGYDTLTIDASGFSRTFDIIPGMETGSIFLYEISQTVLGKIVSVGSMLSKAHDTVIIADWLSRWFDLVEVRTRCIVVDGSLALLSAITLGLYNFCYRDYLEWIFHVLLEHEKISTFSNILIHPLK